MSAARFVLSPKEAALLVIDMQEKLLPKIDRSCALVYNVCRCISGCKELGLPLFMTEQYPQGLGTTVAEVRNVAGVETPVVEKTSFSGCACESIPFDRYQQWIVVGIEAHVCVLQTVRDLLRCDKDVVVVNDCISSRSIYDFSTAIAEMRDFGARISSFETVLFDLLRDAKHPAFKAISALIKEETSCVSCSS